MYTRYRNRASGFVITDRGRREGEAIRTFVLTRNCNRSTTSMSNLTLFERYFSDPTLSRSTRFDILSLSLSPFHTLFDGKRERERGRERESVGKDRGMENYGYQAEKGKHFAREGAYRRNTDRDNWSQVTRTYEKGRR